MIEFILLLVTILILFLDIWYYFDIGTRTALIIGLLLPSICLAIIINRYMKTKRTTLSLIFTGVVSLLIISYCIFMWVFLMTFELF